MAAYAVPVLLVGWQRTVPPVAAGLLGTSAPTLLLVWLAVTPQSGFCF